MAAFWVFWAAALLGAAAVQPYQATLLREQLARAESGKPPLPLNAILLLSFLQSGLILGVAAYIGTLLAPQVGLEWPLLAHWLSGAPLRRAVWPIIAGSLALGALGALAVAAGDRFLFPAVAAKARTAAPPPSRGQALAAALYGGLSEEVLARLFLLSFVVYVLFRSGLGGWMPFWLGVAAAAIGFAAGHLPLAYRLLGRSPAVLWRTLTLNGALGVLFGWLFWQWGLESAMIAHFAADAVLHVALGPALPPAGEPAARQC